MALLSRYPHRAKRTCNQTRTLDPQSMSLQRQVENRRIGRLRKNEVRWLRKIDRRPVLLRGHEFVRRNNVSSYKKGVLRPTNLNGDLARRRLSRVHKSGPAGCFSRGNKRRRVRQHRKSLLRVRWRVPTPIHVEQRGITMRCTRSGEVRAV